MMIKAFEKTCCQNADKLAFVCGKKEITYARLQQDIYRAENLLAAQGLSAGDKVLLFVLPSYAFYVLLFACIRYGVNVVVMDSYRGFGRIRRVMRENKIARVFCNNATAPLCGLLGKGVKRINISKYERYPNNPRQQHEVCDGLTVLTTFTSGTTGAPKSIHRTRNDLAEQIKLVSDNVQINATDVVWSNLPIYVLFVVYCGMTCVIDRRISSRRLGMLGVTAVLASISAMLGMRKSAPGVQKLYFGGALLYPNQAAQLQSKFPNAKVGYVYGASECVLIAKGDIEHYLVHNNALETTVQGIRVWIKDADAYGVGRVCAQGRVVLTDDGTMVGSDLGYIDKYGLHIVGRAQYSRMGCYNYLTDMRLLAENPKVKKGFSFIYNDKIWFCYQGRLSHKSADVQYVRFLKIPMDAKHRTKPNYTRLISRIAK